MSALSFIANLGITIGLTEFLAVHPTASFAASQFVLLLVNFFAVRHVIFEVAHLPVRPQAVRFILLTSGFRFAEWTVFALLNHVGAADYRLLVALVLMFSSAVKFLAYRRVLAPSANARSVPRSRS